LACLKLVSAMSNYYNHNAKQLFDKYQSVDPEKVHARWLGHLPSSPKFALDVGGGSGRDAKWLAEKGWEVVVVEPAAALLQLGQRSTQGSRVTWIDDRLPHLSNLDGYKNSFSLILVSGVLMHLPCAERLESLRRLVGFMTENGVLIVTLRHGPDTEERGFYQVEAEEVIDFAEKQGMHPEVHGSLTDELGRKEVTWQTVVLTKE